MSHYTKLCCRAVSMMLVILPFSISSIMPATTFVTSTTEPASRFIQPTTITSRTSGPPYASFVNVSNNPNVIDTLPSVASDPSGGVHIAWMGTYASPGSPDGVTTNVFYSKKASSTFSVPVSIPVTTGYYSKDITLAVDTNGYAHIAFRRSENQVWDTLFDDIFYASNSGGNFTTTLVIDGGSGGGPWAAGPRRPSLAVDNSGIAHLVFLGSAGTEIFYTNNATGTFATPVEVPGGTVWSVDPPSAVVDRLGNVHIAFKGKSTDQWGDIFYTNNVGGGFGSPINLSQAGIEYDLSLAVDSYGRAYVVYSRMEQPNICYVTNKSGDFSSPDCFGSGGKPNIAVDDEGNVHIVYRSSNVMYANNISGSFQPISLTDNGSLVTDVGSWARWFSVSSDDTLHVVFHGVYPSQPLEGYEIYYLGVPMSELVKIKTYLPIVVR